MGAWVIRAAAAVLGAAWTLPTGGCAGRVQERLSLARSLLRSVVASFPLGGFTLQQAAFGLLSVSTFFHLDTPSVLVSPHLNVRVTSM